MTFNCCHLLPFVVVAVARCVNNDNKNNSQLLPFVAVVAPARCVNNDNKNDSQPLLPIVYICCHLLLLLLLLVVSAMTTRIIATCCRLLPFVAVVAVARCVSNDQE